MKQLYTIMQPRNQFPRPHLRPYRQEDSPMYTTFLILMISSDNLISLHTKIVDLAMSIYFEYSPLHLLASFP